MPSWPLTHLPYCKLTSTRLTYHRAFFLPAISFTLLIILCIFSSNQAFARTNTDTPDITATKHSILTIQKLEQQGLITHSEAEKSIAYYLDQASKAVGHPLTLNEVLAAPEPRPQKLTPLQEFAGAIDFVNVILVLAILVTAGSIIYLCGYYIKILIQLLRNIPIIVYEVLCYIACLGCGISGLLLAEPMRSSLGFAGCLLFIGALGFAASHRPYLAHQFRFSGILFLVWTAMALIFNSPTIGFIAVAAFLSALGFSIIITPLCYGFGFTDRATIGRTTLAAFIVLALFICIRVSGAILPFLSIFEFGALFLGSFVGYIGLLISSSRRYRGQRKYWQFQIVTIIAGLGALFFGSVFHIDELQRIGGTFFVLYCIEKLMELPVETKPAFAALFATVGALTIGFCWFVLTHQEVFRHFLFIPG